MTVVKVHGADPNKVVLRARNAKNAVMTRRWFSFLPICSLISALFAGPASADPYPVAVLRGLDKVTGRVTTLNAPVGEPIRFGALEIIVRTCDKRPPEEPPESAAFLEITESKEGSAKANLFHGWMFASSPALSAMDHAVYDVWVLDCVSTASTDASSSSSETSE